MSHRKSKSKTVRPSALSAPHSWRLVDWDNTAPHVAPGNARKAKYLFRMHRAELLAAGAVARIGRDLIFFGVQYEKFLKRGAARVPDYEIAANRSREAAA